MPEIERRFHPDLRRILKEQKLSAQKVSQQAGLGKQILGQWLRTGFYPRDLDLISRIGHILGQPEEIIEGWRAEATSAGIHGRARDPEKQQTVLCAACGNAVTTYKSIARNRKYCSAICREHGKRTRHSDSVLQARVLAKLKDKNKPTTAAAMSRETGVSYPRIARWLNRANARLNSNDLAAVARWLGIDFTEAVRLQGGTVEDRRRESAKVAGQQTAARAKEDPSFGQKITEAAHAATRNKPLSPDHRRKISEALKKYRQRPDAHSLGDYSKTMRGRALSIVRANTLNHPDWTDDKVRDVSIARLQEKPYNLGSEEAARVLLEPGRAAVKSAIFVDREQSAKQKKPGPKPQLKRAAWIARKLVEEGVARGSDLPYGFVTKLVNERRQRMPPEKRYKALTQSGLQHWIARNRTLIWECYDELLNAGKDPRPRLQTGDLG